MKHYICLAPDFGTGHGYREIKRVENFDSALRFSRAKIDHGLRGGDVFDDVA